MPPKRKSASRQSGRAAAKIAKQANPAPSASSDLVEVSAAQQTAAPVNMDDLASVVTVAVTEAILSCGRFTTLVPSERIQFWFTFLPS